MASTMFTFATRHLLLLAGLSPLRFAHALDRLCSSHILDAVGMGLVVFATYLSMARRGVKAFCLFFMAAWHFNGYS